jgi:hypothetical protein
MQHRTIDMSEPRRRQVALAAAASNVSSHQWIQAAITAGLLSQAANDETFALSLMRSAGIPWDTIQSIVKETAEDRQS